MRKGIITALSVCLLATGCADLQGIGPKQGIGTLGGAALGGLGGSQFGGGSGKMAMTAAGTLLGAFIGSGIGVSLDRADRAYAERAMIRAYNEPVGSAVEWKNPQTGNSGVIVPRRVGHDANGYQCREYQQTVYVGGRKQEAYGRACQQQDGTWMIVN